MLPDPARAELKTRNLRFETPHVFAFVLGPGLALLSSSFRLSVVAATTIVLGLVRLERRGGARPPGP